jgi:hypothetical protein
MSPPPPVPTVVAEKASGSVTCITNMSSWSKSLSDPLIDVREPGPAPCVDCAVPGRAPASPSSVHGSAGTADTHASTTETASTALWYIVIVFPPPLLALDTRRTIRRRESMVLLALWHVNISFYILEKYLLKILGLFYYINCYMKY